MIGLSPSLVGVVQLTSADFEAGRAVTSVGFAGTTAAAGVTGLDWADARPLPLAFAARTVNVYVVPVVRPVIFFSVAGGVPEIVVAGCATEPMYGVIV